MTLAIGMTLREIGTGLSEPKRQEAELYEKRRKEKLPEVEYRSLARSNGIAGFLQHRLRFREVSLADDFSAATHWPHAGL